MQFMGRQRVGHDLVTEQQCIYIVFLINYSKSTTLTCNVNRENSVYMWREEGYGTSLYLFFYKSKTFLKNKVN